MKTVQNNASLLLLQRIIQELDGSELPRSVTHVLQKIKQERQSITVLKFIQLQINNLHSAKRWGTARNYEKTLKSFSHFLHGKDIPFEMMTISLINEYNAYLIQRNIVRNSISFYMRNLRAIFNKAVRQRLIPFSNPFIEVYTGIDHTRKR
ncbi:MAG: phage integrase SAM-like domain-containing protein, partial [Bacteroidales bacterium]|nr:phage integrase SAM-like domain-containing protein [Bacteroidales bacterium]